MAEPTVSEVVAWFEEDHALEDISYCQEYPELVWEAILKVLQRDLTQEEKGDLLVGPLEELLYLHGADFIDRLEQAAQADSQFNHLLGGVWRAGMPLEVWERVQKVRKEVW